MTIEETTKRRLCEWQARRCIWPKKLKAHFCNVEGYPSEAGGMMGTYGLARSKSKQAKKESEERAAKEFVKHTLEAGRLPENW